MKKAILPTLFLTVCAYALAEKDQIIMTVNGEDVPKSEFEYLYHKNNQQQLSAQPLDEYVEMFKIYKMKVADAKAAGIDTTANFKREMRQYKRELSAPYIADSAYIYSFIDVAADRATEEVEASHIMFVKSRDAVQNLNARHRADSVRNVLLNGGDFTDLAIRFSEDKTVERNNGYMGYIGSGRFPYEFETAVWETPAGQISEVIESPAGYHIVKPGARRPSRGRVEAAHIMKMVPQGASEEVKAKAKAEIDSLYNIVSSSPGRFGEIAKKNSDDKGSARQDGKLPIFGSGEMVPEFEAAAFALADGEISQPIQSMYGWHIIHKIGSKGAPTRDELKDRIVKSVSNPQDVRAKLNRQHDVERLAAKHKASLNREVLAEMSRQAREAGIDSLYLANWTTMPNSIKPIATVDNREIPASELADAVKRINEPNGELAQNMLEEASQLLFYKLVTEAEQDWLLANNEDYRNLMNEYTDGSLLYEISLAKVWDKAAKDEEGLTNYYNAHKDKYIWDAPRAKGYLIQAQNDSIAALVKEKMAAAKTDDDVMDVRKQFTGTAVIEKVLIPKGINAMVDNIMFGGEKTKPKVANLNSYFMSHERIIEAPEEMSDVKGQVTTDYQAVLEEEWVKELKEKYPVKVNKKVLSKVKP